MAGHGVLWRRVDHRPHQVHKGTLAQRGEHQMPLMMIVMMFVRSDDVDDDL